MPIFPINAESHQVDEVGGSFKTAHQHEDPRFLTLQFRKDRGDASTESSLESFLPKSLTEKERDGYVKSRFYLRKSLHVLNPQFFPDCHFSSNQALVVEKKEGKSLRWDMMLSPERNSILNTLDNSGVKRNTIDINGNNFIKTPEGIAYVDNVVNTHYFFLLKLSRLEDAQQTVKYLDNDEYHDFLIYLFITYFDKDARTATEFTQPLDEIISKEGDAASQKTLSDMLKRYAFHMDTLKPLQENVIETALLKIIDADPRRFFQFVHTTAHFPELKPRLRRILALKRPLLWLKIR